MYGNCPVPGTESQILELPLRNMRFQACEKRIRNFLLELRNPAGFVKK